MKVAVVGPNSQLGKALTQKLLQNNYEVFEWSRDNYRDSPRHTFFDINQKFTGSTAGLDAICILAWKQSPRNKKTFSQNISSIGALINDAQLNNVRVVFVSTLGAVGTSRSFHVNAKKILESQIQAGSIIRPASIVDDSGSFAGNIKWLERLTIPVEIKFSPNLYHATVSMKSVLNAILKELQNDSSSSPINLIERVSALTVGKSYGWRIKININTKIASHIFTFLRHIPLTTTADIADKWFALESTQEFLNNK